jgi:VWFA-related protein
MPARVLLVVALCPFLLPVSFAQTSRSDAVKASSSVIHTTTREVLLDLVVRDKHHHAVTDLRPEEVEVYEDGVRQSIRVFRNIQGSEQLQTERAVVGASNSATTAKSGDDPHPLNSMRQVNFVSVVLAQIAPLNLEFARRAVLEFLKSDNLPNTYVTVYRLDRNLELVQPFTADKDSLAKAVDAATKDSASDSLQHSRQPQYRSCREPGRPKFIGESHTGVSDRSAVVSERRIPGCFGRPE